MTRAWWVAAGLIIATCPLALARGVDQAPPQIVELTLGIQGHYKLGRWRPIGVTISGGAPTSEGRVEIELVDGDGQPFVVSTAYRLDASGNTTVWMHAKPGRTSDVRVTVRDQAGEALAERVFLAASLPAPLSDDQELILVVGPPIGIEAAASLDARGADGRRWQVVALPTLDRLPDRISAYDAVDTVLIHASRPDIAGSEREARSRVAVLHDWVARGGRVIVSAGRLADQWLSDGGLLAPFAPGKFAGLVELRRLGPLESFSEPTPRSESPPAAATEAFRLDVARLVDVQGVIEAHGDEGPNGLPLVVRAPLGFGEMLFVTFDLDAPALAAWSGRPRLVRRLLDRDPAGSEDGGQTAQQDATWRVGGYRDLAEQLRHALDQFDTVPALPFWAIVAIGLSYVALIGPIDYLLVRRRPYWTWGTSAGVVMLVTVAAFWAGGASGHRAPHARAMHIVDVDMASGELRGTTWTSVLAVDPDRFEIAAPVGSFGRIHARDSQIANLNPPAPWVGGARLGLAAEPYLAGEGDIRRLPLAANSSKAFAVDWAGKAMVPADTLMVDPFGKPLGKIVNPLDVPLTDVVLFYATLAYPLGTLHPGEELEIGPHRQAAPATAVLTRQRVIEDRDTATRYDPSSLDLDRIVEMILFHDAAGGKDYTKLTSNVHRRLDLSRQLQLGRAILFGRMAGDPAIGSWPSIRSENGGAVTVQAASVFRFVLPVVAHQPHVE